MKKIFLIICLMLFSFSYGNDYSSFCSTSNVNKTFGGKVLSAVGFNSLSRNIIENEIERALKKALNSEFDIKIDSFMGTNVLNGEFASLKAKTPLFSYNGFYSSSLEAETICGYNKISIKDGKINFDEPTVLKFSSQITQDDLDKMMTSSDYDKVLEEVNSINLFKIQNPKLTIKDTRLVLKYEVLPLPKFLSGAKIKPVDVVIGTNLKVEDNKIQLCDFDFNSIKASPDKLLPLVNMLNPLDFKVNVSKNNESELHIENIQIKDSIITFDGFVVINKTN